MENSHYWDQALEALPQACVDALNDPMITDVHINPTGDVYLEGFVPKRHIGTIPPAARDRFCRVVAKMVDAEFVEDTPDLHGYLPEPNIRIEAARAPRSIDVGVALRKLSGATVDFDDYESSGMLDPDMRKRITHAIAHRANVLIAGSTGAGKTTLLNACLQQVHDLTPSDRVGTIEDTRELQTFSADVYPLYTTREFTMDQAVEKALRLMLDRLIVGEVRTSAAVALIHAWNTGHEGGFCTIHAGRTSFKQLVSTLRTDIVLDTLERVEGLFARVMTVDASARALIAKAIDVIIVIQRIKPERAAAIFDKPLEAVTVGDQINITHLAVLEDYDETEGYRFQVHESTRHLEVIS